MRAIVFSTKPVSEFFNTALRPLAMMEILGVPAIQRIVEHLMDVGVRELDFVLQDKPHTVRAFLGDGTRWGGWFRFHLTRDPARPFSLLPLLAPAEDEHVLVGSASYLPPDPASVLRQAFEAAKPAVLCGYDGDQLRWAGWAVVDSNWLREVPGEWTEDEFADELVREAQARGSVIECGEPVRMRSAGDLIAANIRALQPGGVRVARNASVHRTAVLTPPVFIGAHSRIGRRARIGPHSSLGENCIVANDTAVTRSVIFSRTYVGPGLFLTDVVADGHQFENTRLGMNTQDSYEMLLTVLPDSFWDLFPGKLIPYGIATGLAVIAVPMLAMFAMARDSVFERRPYLRHFAQELIPALPSILGGRRKLVGVTEWTAQDLSMAPEPWRGFYGSSAAGVVTEQLVRFGPNPIFEERAAADAYFAIRHTPARDARLMAGYALRVVGDLWFPSRG